MREPEDNLTRLFHSARRIPDKSSVEVPFAFETRVVALWRAANGETNDLAEVTRFVRSIGVIASVLVILASAGAYREFIASEAQAASVMNEYAIADTAIETEVLQ